MKILVLGATGYVGQNISKYLANKGHLITGFVREAKDFSTIEALGAQALLGNLNDKQSLNSLGRDHDVIIWAAQLMLEDEERVVKALLSNLKGTGKAFLFTSGTSLLSERTDGSWSENTYAEDDIFIPRQHIAPRLKLENIVRNAVMQGVRAYCVRPPLLWGHGGSKVIADMYHSAAKTGAVCYVNQGLNLYSNVHIDDLAELYRLTLENGIGGALYHAVSGETNFRSIAEKIASHLKLPTRSITVTDAINIWDKFMGPIVFAGCSRTRSPRSRNELGWKPHPDRLDIFEDCIDPRYEATMYKRKLPTWVRPV